MAWPESAISAPLLPPAAGRGVYDLSPLRKFVDSVRSKTPRAMANDVPCKVRCHNVVVVIQEMHEIGIGPGFGRTDTAESSTVLRFSGA